MEGLRSFLELIYFLSGPAILVASLYGLKHIKIANKNLQETKNSRILSSKREAYTLAGEQCKYYIETIIPLINALDKKISEKNIDFFEKSKVSINGNEITIKPYLDNNALDKVFTECLSELLTVLNHLEGFSVFFAAGVAADEVGFNTLGVTYTRSIRYYLPFIIPYGIEGNYKHLKELFVTWNSRIEKENLLKEKAKVEERLKKQNTTTIVSIGTE